MSPDNRNTTFSPVFISGSHQDSQKKLDDSKRDDADNPDKTHRDDDLLSTFQFFEGTDDVAGHDRKGDDRGREKGKDNDRNRHLD